MRRRAFLYVVLLVAFFLPGASRASSPDRSQHRLALVRRDHVRLYAHQSAHSRVLTVLVQQTQVEVLGQNKGWYHVKVWASVGGWLKQNDVVFRSQWSTVSTYQAPTVRNPVRAHAPRALAVSAQSLAAVPLSRGPGRPVQATLPTGSRLWVSGWQQDASGAIWYRVRNLWAPGANVQFNTPDPGTVSVRGQTIWKPVSGKGMWLTEGTIADSDPSAIVRAALQNHITHLYLESAISPWGFHTKREVGPLIDAGHASHLAIIAWVYPYLSDVGADVDLTRQVARFRTSSGERFDGVAADLERNVHLWNVRAYSQLVRAYLGSHYLLVGVTYPPQSFPDYPFLEAAHNYNLLAPMDYWHQTNTAFGLDYGHMRYGYQYAYRYAADSVASIRRLSGHVPVAPIGQSFDNFGRLEMGPHAPSAREIDGFLSGSKSSGAVGASFFQWMTTTVPEWHAIRNFKF